MGRRAHRHRRRDPRRHRERWRGLDHQPLHAGAGRGPRTDVLRGARAADDRRQRRVPGLQPRLAPHLGPVQPDLVDGRLVPRRADAHLACEPRLHEHPLVSLRRRVAVQRRRGRHHRPRLQPVGDPRRLSPPGAHRQRRRARALDVQGDHRRRPLPEAVRPGADRPAAARPYRHRPLPAGPRGLRRRARGPVLLVGHALGNAFARASAHARDDGHRSRARGAIHGDTGERSDGRGRAGLRAPPPPARRLLPREGRRHLRGEPRQHPDAGAQGGDAEDQDLHRLELGQVLPRRSDGACHGAAPRPHGELGQEGNRNAVVGDLGDGRRDLHPRQGVARSGGRAKADCRADRHAAAAHGE